MISKRAVNTFIICCLTLLLFPACAKGELIGVTWPGFLYSIDEETGVGTHVGQVGMWSESNSLAIDARGTFYTTRWYSHAGESRHNLVRINREGDSWVVTEGPSISMDIRALAFSPDGTLFATRKDGAKIRLYTVDLETGALTFVGDPGVAGIQGLDFSPDGTLYGYDVGDGSGTGLGLVTIDPVTGAATDVDPTLDGSAQEVQTIAFAPDGTLYGAYKSLFTIDVDSGALTLIGSGGYSEGLAAGVRGIAWIPAPSRLLALLSMGASALAVYLWRKRWRMRPK